jgi:hypothetical protein
MTDSDMAYVAVAPRDPLEADIVEKVSSVIGMDLSGTHALMNSAIPRIFGKYATLKAAETIAERLKSLGLLALVFDHAQLHQHPVARFRAHTLQPSDGAITFCDKYRNPKRVEAKDVFLILRGTVRTQVERETIKTRREVNMPTFALAASLVTAPLTGMVPVAHTPMENTKDESLKTEDYARLYGWISPEPLIEISQSDFDYSCLETRKGLTSLENISTVIRGLREAFPAAIFDERLTGHIRMDEPFVALKEEIEINCRLIYLCHRATVGPSPTA